MNLAPELEQESRSSFVRLGGRLLDAVPSGLEDGPPAGRWREQRELLERKDALFADILVSLQGTAADWQLLDATIAVAQRERARILAIHALDHKRELKNKTTRSIKQIFKEKCKAAGIEAEFAAEVGVEGNLMIERAAWADLVATNLTFATESKPRLPISSGVDLLIQRCPRPILVLTGEQASPMNRALLGYDGSPKADEALYVAAYLASRWDINLAVVTVETDYTSAVDLERARDYLSGQNISHVTYHLRSRPIADAVMETAVELQSNLMIIGGFGFRPVRHLVLGSTVDRALREFKYPLLICR